MPNYAVQSPTNPMRGIERGGIVGYSFGALAGVAISSLTRAASGIVTLVTTGNHNFAAGEICTLTDQISVAAVGKIVSVGGTRFGGNYLIQSVTNATTVVLLPLDDVILHQPADTATGGQANSIQYEAPTPPQAGKAFALPMQGAGASGGIGFYVNGVANGAPGAFEVDVQVADVDADARYTTIASGNVTTVGTNNSFHLDATWTEAKFARAKLVSNGNSVGWIITIGA